MLRKTKTTIVINGLEDFIRAFPDGETWLKENLQIDQIHWDEFENIQKIVKDYLDDITGEYSVLVNQREEQLMVLEIHPAHYMITGELSGNRVKMTIGSKEDIDRAFISWARKNYSPDIAGVEDAKIFIDQNRDTENGAVIF